MSGEPEQEFFADGITEDILTELSRFRELLVISRNSVFAYKGKAINVQKVAKELGVQYVVEGSVRKSGSRVRITVQLIDAETDRHLWAERFDRPSPSSISCRCRTSSRRNRRPRSSDAGRTEKPIWPGRAQSTLKPITSFYADASTHSYTPRSGNLEARKLLERAVTINSDFAAALAFIAFTHVNDYINGWADLAERSLQTGLEIAQRAVQVDEEEPQAHFVVGVALLWSRKHDRALAELQRSVAIAPNFAEAHLAIAHVLIYSGDAAERWTVSIPACGSIPCIGISRLFSG